MDHRESSDKDGSERRNSNSEWLPTKCRITKPPPPKPATNPLQFVKVAPCPLYKKAQEQIRKVEEVKLQRHTVKDDGEEWQQNLDNWKSSRRKRQEHIIERVVEVKKLEQEGHDKSRRKSKTFSEIVEDRNKRGLRLNIPIFDDDSNDLSDYGIGSSSSKTNSVKDVDTDDSSSCLDEKDPGISTSDFQSGKDASSASNQSQSEDELLSSTPCLVDKENNSKPNEYNNTSQHYSTTMYTNIFNKQNLPTKSSKPKFEIHYQDDEEFKVQEYTYEGAIQDYRSRISSKISGGETIFNVQFDKNAVKPIPKIDVYRRKEVFESEKPVQVTHLDLGLSKRLSEDFANSLSIKERLKNLERCTDLQVKNVEKNTQGSSVKSIIQNLTKQSDIDIKNNNLESSKTNQPVATTDGSYIGNLNKSVSIYLVDPTSNVSKNNTNELLERCLSPEADTYMNKLNQFNKDLDSYLIKTHSPQASLSDYGGQTTAPPSDREDSGIHTADVSCSVSQADESVEYNDMLSSTLPNCIEKLQKERERELIEQIDCDLTTKLKEKLEDSARKFEETHNLEYYVTNYKVYIESTQSFLDDVRYHTSKEYEFKENSKQSLPTSEDNVINIANKSSFQEVKPVPDHTEFLPPPEPKNKPVIYENIVLKNYNVYADNAFDNSAFPLAPPKTKEPPKEKPPPPPPPDEDEKPKPTNVKRLNSTKRIKKEIHIKRSSFLGLDEPTDDQIDPVISIDTPPDINTFLQKESQLEKTLYRKYQDSRETCLSEVESQDSGLESERGRLSSDTWCSSLGESNTSTHGRQDSEQTNNSVTSEEDEIAKKEREIIALVEKEEKSKDNNHYTVSKPTALSCCNLVNNMKNEQFNIPYFPTQTSKYNMLDMDQDSEVLKVEHELLQLEREEAERQKENILFKENRDKLLRKNRYSLENICDTPDTFSPYYEDISCRKSLPELQKELHTRSGQKWQMMKPNIPHYKPASDNSHYRKSMPDIQQAYLRSVDINNAHNEIQLPLEHRKSMPELPKMTMLAGQPYTSFNRQPVMPGKPLTSLIKEQRDKEKLFMTKPLLETESAHYQNIKPGAPISRPALNVLSAVPKHRHVPNDNWIQPKMNGDNKQKSYNKHWLYQEAELRRLAEQKVRPPKWSYQQANQEKHIPEPIIQTLTQRFQNSVMVSDRNQRHKRPENSINPEVMQRPPYLSRPHTVGHASPVSYPPITTVENTEGKMLSVSGKKKCSFCGNELGRGAAMIIESLCLFYHMDCFKCCVCHIQLGDGLMGTDVRVRNQKLHCHNCYTSDDGVKFSCV